MGGPNHKDDSITSSIGSAAPRQSLFSMQHFCNTRFNHLAAILLNAVYHGKESERERERERCLTAAQNSKINSLEWRAQPPLPVTVSQLEMHTGHLAANSRAISAKKGKYVKGVMT